jgi:hypothetical protein
VKIKDEQAQVVDTFTYLEVVTSAGGYDVDIKNRLRKTNSNFWQKLLFVFLNLFMMSTS